MRVAVVAVVLLALLGIPAQSDALFKRKNKQQEKGVKSFREIVQPAAPVKPFKCVLGYNRRGKCRLGLTRPVKSR